MDETRPSYKALKKVLLENLKREPERVRDSVKLLWARKPKPYGIKVYKEKIVMEFD